MSKYTFRSVNEDWTGREMQIGYRFHLARGPPIFSRGKFCHHSGHPTVQRGSGSFSPGSTTVFHWQVSNHQKPRISQIQKFANHGKGQSLTFLCPDFGAKIQFRYRKLSHTFPHIIFLFNFYHPVGCCSGQGFLRTNGCTRS